MRAVLFASLLPQFPRVHYLLIRVIGAIRRIRVSGFLIFTADISSI